MGNTVPEQIHIYGTYLAKVWGPMYEVLHKEVSDELPYRWEVRTIVEPVKYVRTISLSSDDILSMNGKSSKQHMVYLARAFGPRN
jgi:hypothetical protein